METQSEFIITVLDDKDMIGKRIPKGKKPFNQHPTYGRSKNHTIRNITELAKLIKVVSEDSHKCLTSGVCLEQGRYAPAQNLKDGEFARVATNYTAENSFFMIDNDAIPNFNAIEMLSPALKGLETLAYITTRSSSHINALKSGDEALIDEKKHKSHTYLPFHTDDKKKMCEYLEDYCIVNGFYVIENGAIKTPIDITMARVLQPIYEKDTTPVVTDGDFGITINVPDDYDEIATEARGVAKANKVDYPNSSDGDFEEELISDDTMLTKNGEPFMTVAQAKWERMEGGDPRFDCPFCDADKHDDGIGAGYGHIDLYTRDYLKCSGRTHPNKRGVTELSEVKAKALTLTEVLELIGEQKEFTGERLADILKHIDKLKSNIDIDTAVENLKEGAKANKVKLTKGAIKAELKKIGKEEIEVEIPFEKLGKKFKEYKPVIYGNKLQILYWTKVPFVLDDKVTEVKSLAIVRPFDLEPMFTGTDKADFKRWFEHSKRPTFKGVVFNPSDDVKLDGYINIYGGYSCVQKKGNVKPFMEHIERVICGGNEEQAKYMKSYIAHQFQKPTKKPLVAIVLKAGKGMGKDTFIDMIGNIYNDAYISVSNKSQVSGQFNGHLSNLMMLNIAEQAFAGSHHEDSVMKNLITNPMLAMEKKGRDVISLPSYLRIYMSSNEDWVVPATGNERRYFIPTISSVKEDTKYFKNLWKWYQNGGKEALLNWALSYDISDFEVTHYPNTEAMDEQKTLTMGHFEKVVFEYLKTFEDGYVIINASEVTASYNMGMKTQYDMTPTSIGIKLKKIFGANERLMIDGKQKRGWRLHLDSAKELFCDYVGVKTLFENDFCIDDTSKFDDLDDF